MDFLERIKSFAKDLVNKPSEGDTFGQIDRKVADRPAANSRHRIKPQEFDFDSVEATDEYRIALHLIQEKAPFVFVTGRAGTGKTTFIRWLCHNFKGNVAIVAPTGLAALTAGGVTIHSFFRFPPSFVAPKSIQKVKHRAVYENLHLLIIDEISMVRVDMMDAIEQFLSLNGPRPGEPFGGVPIVAVGDMHQLPPISDQSGIRQYIEDNYNSPYFFSAHALKNIKPLPLELKRVFRQKDNKFLAILNDIRTGQNLEKSVENLNRLCLDSSFTSSAWTTLVPTRKLASEINEQHLASLPGPTKEYVGEIAGQFFSNQNYQGKNEDELDRMLPAPYKLRLRIGARVVFTKNGSSWVNGTTGIVREIKPNVIQVQIDDEGTDVVVDVQRTTWDKGKYRYDQATKTLVSRSVGSFKQFPLALGWAMTIHKAQGQTLSRVIVDLDWGTFATGQAYVALSRARSIQGLKLRRPIKTEDVISDQIIRSLYQRIAENDIAEQWREEGGA